MADMRLFEDLGGDFSNEPSAPAKAPHDFVLNRETRRMQCSRCGGIMNECEPTCRKTKT